MDKNIVKDLALARKKRRIRKNIYGSAERPRLSIFRSEKHIYGQIIDDDQGVTLASVSSVSKDLRAEIADKSPVEVAQLVGQALAQKAAEKDITSVVFDRNGRRYAGRIASFAEGARAGGLNF